MASTSPGAVRSSSADVYSAGDSAPTSAGRLSTETKSSVKTTELIFYVAAVAGVLTASYVVKATRDHGDYFRADRAWFYVVLLTIGYLASRGLAKSGSREHYDPR